MGERGVRNAEVRGSIPLISISKKPNPLSLQWVFVFNQPQNIQFHLLTQTHYTKQLELSIMRPSHRSPSYIIRNPYSYCFRMVVPKDLQGLVGKKEMRYSLKTGYLGVAKYKARLLAGQVQRVFRYLRKGYFALSTLSDEKIKQLVSKYITDYLEDLEGSYYNSDKPPFKTTRDYDEHIGDALDYYKEITAKRLGMGDYGPVEGKVAEMLEKNGIDPIDKETMPYIKLCREMYRADIGLLEVEKRHLKGDFSYHKELPDIFPDFLEKPAERGNQTTRLSEVIRHYVAENEKNNWTEKSKQEIESSLNLFLEVMGDVSIKSISRRQVSEFRDTLQKLPSNMNKVKKYRDKSIQELLEMNIAKTLAVRTINKIMTRVSTLFNHALNHEFIKGQNPATDMNLPLGKSEDENRAPFTIEELERLMQSDEYINDTHQISYQFWIPIIALFTGMRQDEIAQLHLDDIRCDEDGIWMIDVNAEGEKKVKTKAGIREIPIHPFMVNELKLPEYVEMLEGEGKKRLFPELKKGRDGYAKSVSQWFNQRYKVKCGIKEGGDGRKKDFHSFRTTIINHLQRKKVPFDMLKQVMGHSKGKDVTQVFYTERYTPKELFYDVVSKVDYGIDLTHLKNSRFILR